MRWLPASSAPRQPSALAECADWQYQAVTRYRWTVKAPGGKEVSWVAAITNDLTDRELTWQSEDGGDIDNSGRVRFEDAGERGTVVRAVIDQSIRRTSSPGW